MNRYLKLYASQLLAIIFVSGWLMSVAKAEELPSVIALFGDSITTGYNADFAAHLDVANGTTTEGRPTTELNRLMDAEPKRNVIVANYGDGGTNSAFGAGRIYTELTRNKSDFPGSDYYVLIIYGTNDQNSGISASATGFNVDTIIRRSQSRGYTAIVGTLPPRSDQLTTIPLRNGFIKTYANSRGAPIVDIYSDFVNYPGGWLNRLIDSETSARTGHTIWLHPNKAGYKRIAQLWFYDELEARIDPIPEPIPIIAPIIYLLLGE